MMGRKPIDLIQIPNQRLFSSKAAACYLGVCADSLRKYADLGWIKARQLEKRRVFALEDLDSFSRRSNPPPLGGGEVAQACPNTRPRHTLTLAENPVERR